MFKKEKSESIFEYFNIILNIINAQQTLNSLGLGLSVNLNTKVDALHYKHSAIFFNFLSLHEEKKKNTHRKLRPNREIIPRSADLTIYDRCVINCIAYLPKEISKLQLEKIALFLFTTFKQEITYFN